MKMRSRLILCFLLAAAPLTAQTTGQSGKDPSPPVEQPTMLAQPSSASNAKATTTPPAPEAAVAAENRPAPTAAEFELQSTIQTAIRRDPTVAAANVNVAVSAEGIELSGNVASRQAHLAASRIAKSYAGGKKVVDKITVSPHGDAAPDPTPEKISTAGARLHQ